MEKPASSVLGLEMVDRLPIAIWQLDWSGSKSAWEQGEDDHRAHTPDVRIISRNSLARDLSSRVAPPAKGASSLLVLPFEACVVSAAVTAFRTGSTSMTIDAELSQTDGVILPVSLFLSFPGDLAENNSLVVMSVLDHSQYGARAAGTIQVRDRPATSLTTALIDAVSQPLSVIQFSSAAALRWMKQADPMLGEIEANLASIFSASKHASDLVHRTRAARDKRDQSVEVLDLRDLVEEVVGLISHSAALKGIVLERSVADDLPSVTGHRFEIREVLLELLANAFDAFPARHKRTPRVTVSAECREEHEVLLTVSDTGVGVHLGHVFRLFDPRFTTKRGRVGSGLTKCRNVIEAHGGKIWFDSVAAGGARFLFTLPADGTEWRPAQARGESASGAARLH